jgi:GNAT superfamily N-acetyltransferase
LSNSPNHPSFAFRPATLSDLPAIAAIDAMAGAADHTALVAELLPLGMSWIAEADGAPAGYALVSRRFFSRPFVELLAVAPSWRRGGVGRRLIAQCEAALDGDRLFTSTNASNAPMRALLDSAGYIASGAIDNLDPGDPELVFVKFRAPA